MTIQLPVLLWTVICFVVFMLLINKTLFQPLRAVMDRRNERIASARAEHDRKEEAYRSALETREEGRKRLLRERAEAQKEEQNRIAALTKERENAAREEKRMTLEAYREELHRESETLHAQLGGTTARLAETARQRLTE